LRDRLPPRKRLGDNQGGENRKLHKHHRCERGEMDHNFEYAGMGVAAMSAGYCEGGRRVDATGTSSSFALNWTCWHKNIKYKKSGGCEGVEVRLRMRDDGDGRFF